MITGFLTIGILQTFAVISPGPDFALIVKNTLSYSRKIGILSALGITSGILFHMIYCLLGFAVIIHQSLILFNIFKYLGAGYLIYIGIKELLNQKPHAEDNFYTEKYTISGLSAFRQGLLCNMLNPKAALFFLGLFTLVISPTTPFFHQAIYVLEILAITFIWFSSLTLLLTHPEIAGRIQRFQPIITKLMGILLIGFGATLALLDFK
jgi:RhtB (resistance to homoserine/threonine) family protein